MRDQYKIANQDKSQNITFKTEGVLFQRQATISGFNVNDNP